MNFNLKYEDEDEKRLNPFKHQELQHFLDVNHSHLFITLFHTSDSTSISLERCAIKKCKRRLCGEWMDMGGGKGVFVGG